MAGKLLPLLLSTLCQPRVDFALCFIKFPNLPPPKSEDTWNIGSSDNHIGALSVLNHDGGMRYHSVSYRTYRGC